MLNIILTVDYEIFGNGRGDPKRHILIPAKKIIHIAKEFGVPLTIMFEVFEYIAYEKYDEELVNDLGYSTAELIKKQIRDFYKNGNDVQLHIHPQFIDMGYRKGKFILKNPYLSAFDLDEDRFYRLLQQGKKKLLSIVDDPNYKCKVLRLSNMPWIEAPKNTLHPMEDLGFKIHSLYSYSPKSNLGLWKINDSEIYEIPIYNLQVNYLDLITLRRIFTTLYVWLNSPPNLLKKLSCQKNYVKDNNKKFNMIWDFSKLNYKEMIKFLKKAIEDYDYEKYEIPLVMIGHTKDFFNKENFKKFLNLAQRDYVNNGIARFTTFKEFEEKFL